MYEIHELDHNTDNNTKGENTCETIPFLWNEEKKLLLIKNSQGINLNFYNYIDIKEEKIVQCFEYNVFLTLNKGQFFGDYALDLFYGLR